MRKNFLNVMSVLIILIFGVVGIKALLHPGFYTSHDGEHQLVRQYVFDQGLRDGQIPVRYNRQLYNGYGYPLFVFTYRLPFYVGELFRLSGFSFVDSIKAVFFVAYILSGLTMFWFARRWGNLAGIIGAILYLWAPYRFSVMFVRAALGEHVAAVFVPLLFGSIPFGKKSKTSVVLGSVAIAGLFLSHAMMAQITLLMFIPWVLMSLRATEGSVAISLKMILKISLMFILGIGLSAYYLIPASAYRELTQKLNPSYYSDHFVTLRQLIYSPWGYTFSMKGTDNDGMSFQVGVAQWLAVGIAVFGCLLLVISKKHKISPTYLGASISLLFIFIVSIFLMTEKSASVWNWWKNYINIDMPWRFLLMTTFASAALGGYVISFLHQYLLKISLVTALIAMAIYGNRNYLRVNKYIEYPDSDLLVYGGTSNSDNEYRPKWDDGGVANVSRPEALISQGKGELAVVGSKSNLLKLAIRADENIRLDIHTLYFPGWKVFIDGKNSVFKYAGEGGIMRVDVSAGYHLVEARFSDTPLAVVGDFITIISFIILISLIKKNYAKA